MRDLFAAALFAHGLAHLVGFAGPWRLIDVERVTYSSYLLNGRLQIGAAAMRAIGVLWLLLALGFFVTSGAVALARPWWTSAATGMSLASLVMCLVGWPASWIGVVVNAAILATLFLQGAWQ